MARPWYPKYPDDYARKTAHLSFAEHGAYGLLIDQYNRTGKPLPADTDALFRVCRGRGASERKALESVLAQFFDRRGDFLHNERADEELARAQEIHEKRVKGGKCSAHARAHAGTQGAADGQVRARAIQSQPQIPNAPHSAGPIEIWKSVWNEGRAYLVANGHSEGDARQALMRWRQNYHETEILQALKTAEANAVELPIPYIQNILNGKGLKNARQPGRNTAGETLRALAREMGTDSLHE